MIEDSRFSCDVIDEVGVVNLAVLNLMDARFAAEEGLCSNYVGNCLIDLLQTETQPMAICRSARLGCLGRYAGLCM